MSLLDRQGVLLPYLHLLGGPFGEMPRYSFEERVAAASHAGVSGIGFDADEFDELLKTRTVGELRGTLDEHGVTIGELQILYAWHFDARFPDYQKLAREREEHMYELAGTFGIGRIKTVIMTPTELPGRDELVERFAAVCDRAAEHGLTVAMEPMSVSPGFDYADTVDLILAADRPNSGFVVDAWHFFRDPDPWTALDRLPASAIVGVELRDGAAEPREDRQEDAIKYNVLPGEGDFDLVRLLRTLDAKGVDTHIAAEVLSAELWPLSAAENVARTVAAVGKVLESARSQ
uniref:Xylose isomerase n=1 Tax=Streptomyces sp. MJ635-86F5 TaxID=1321967 RepID=X5IBU6_9ACTN|nr:xylose isomerase [Streptomyces sp. MJ635-86F5]